MKNTRREFIKHSGIVLGYAAIGSPLLLSGSYKPAIINKLTSDGEDVSPAEDLMREHGVLKRVMLIYQEIIDRIASNSSFPPETVIQSADIIRKFIEEYHEKLEEDFLFPRFNNANTLTELVAVLTMQHLSGRELTDKIRALAKKGLKQKEDRIKLKECLYSFNRMYAPHEAREDTVLFPAFRKIVSSNEYDSLGGDFEKKEHQLFGKDGFESMVDKVAAIEKKLNIYDLSLFTP